MSERVRVIGETMVVYADEFEMVVEHRQCGQHGPRGRPEWCSCSGNATWRPLTHDSETNPAGTGREP